MEVEIGGGRGGCGCMSCLTTLLSLVFGVVLTAGILVVVEQSHAGSDAAAIEALEQCSAVTDVLGSPIREAPVSLGCGEYNGGSGHARANFSIRVQGPKGSGSLSYDAEHQGGPWTVNRATVSTSSGTIAAVPCASGKDKPDGAPRKRRPRKKRR